MSTPDLRTSTVDAAESYAHGQGEQPMTGLPESELLLSPEDKAARAAGMAAYWSPKADPR